MQQRKERVYTHILHFNSQPNCSQTNQRLNKCKNCNLLMTVGTHLWWEVFTISCVTPHKDGLSHSKDHQLTSGTSLPPCDRSGPDEVKWWLINAVTNLLPANNTPSQAWLWLRTTTQVKPPPSPPLLYCMYAQGSDSMCAFTCLHIVREWDGKILHLFQQTSYRSLAQLMNETPTCVIKPCETRLHSLTISPPQNGPLCNGTEQKSSFITKVESV